MNNKKRILVINPNSSKKMTADIAHTLEKLKIENLIYELISCKDSPEFLESFKDYVDASFNVVKLLEKTPNKDFDGYLLACMGDPGIYALKEIVKAPIIGIAEAAISTSLLLGFKFSILAASKKAKYMMESMVLKYGLNERLASVEYINSNIEGIMKSEEFLIDSLKTGAKKAQLKGAEVLILGCAAMTALPNDLVTEIPILDPIKNGVFLLESIINNELNISKAGLYM
ncbi:aspartate/glutamate racemase family protein [Miniphocaeibacter halophilus]|uniref:Uncharacterized protein n=1 Tax=Miniphocaeibacter halophilus TaxID=2931922 RepID=A0AC61MU82_9FIRM|nr:aspartate/glutamate racemase family protein [Miniphocaeibacter halophilus]QQK06953.1 hypothetical protein JFY71_06285 [Miniphocaeibacter halophilus]